MPPFRWKLSTRERKKSLEDSLKTSDYSEHHLIPVYGFRRNDNNEDESDVVGRGRYGGTTGGEERRMELRRLEARALAAERTSMERRARAEGGAGGAAFARAMSRRALAKAEWIQKVGSIAPKRFLTHSEGRYVRGRRESHGAGYCGPLQSKEEQCFGLSLVQIAVEQQSSPISCRADVTQ